AAADAGSPGGLPAGQAPAQPVRAVDLTGRDFAGVQLPAEPVEGPLRLEASVAHVWTETPAPLPSGVQRAPTRRLLLEGDVRIDVGPARFFCRRAVVWLGQREDSAWQVFLYMAD